MIVLDADMRKRSHILAAVVARTGELLGDTITVGDRGLAAALEWAGGLGEDRAWALEDCRDVSVPSSGSCAFKLNLLTEAER